VKSGAKTGRAGEERKGHSFEHRRTLYCFVVGAPDWRLCTCLIKSKTASVW
jgi:hypothetical protein